METHIVAQGKNQSPQLDVIPPVIDMSSVDVIHFAVIEGGMASGDPSVIIATMTERGTFVSQTSLDKFISAAQLMATMAEDNWGWKREEGYFSLGPMPKDVRKRMLEQVKAELEQWDEIEEKMENVEKDNDGQK